MSKSNGSGLYSGILYKLIYNAAFVWHLRNWYECNDFAWISTPVWLASYGILAAKTKV